MGKVVLENLRKEFGETVAVEDLSLTIEDKSFVCLLGPSGCGKTTILRMVCGLLFPTRGEIYIDDRRVTYLPPKERKIGLVFQDYAIFPSMNGFDNIAYGPKIRGTSKEEIRREVLQLAELLGIKHVLQKSPFDMNQSELQRIALARTLITKPSILLLDEPLSNLDAAFRVKMRAELKRLHIDLKQTVIYVTHDQIEAMSLADKVAVMSRGWLQQYGAPEEVYSRPSNRFVAGFIGSPPMNFIDCTFEESNGKAYLNEGTFKIEVTKFKDIIEKEAKSPELIMGVRPEDIRLFDKPAKGAIEVAVYAFEPLGAESVVDVMVGKTLLRILTPVFFTGASQEKMYVEFDLQKIHVFDKKTDEAIV